MDSTVEIVEVKLLSYKFQFRRIRWREQAAIHFDKKKDPQRVLLAHALLEVSGIKPKDSAEAVRVMDAIPAAIVTRVFKLWRGSFPPARRFTTSRLYRAPEPSQYSTHIRIDEQEEDFEHDRVVSSMESKFGLQEVAETRDLNQKILSAARRREGGFRGAVPATEEK